MQVKKKNNKNQNKIEELPKSAKEKDEPSSGGVASGSGAASIGVQAMEEDDGTVTKLPKCQNLCCNNFALMFVFLTFL